MPDNSSCGDTYRMTKSNKRKTELELMYLPRPASDYRGSYPLHFEKHIKRLLGTENYIHVFSGKATTGLRVDLKFEINPDVVASAEYLPFRDEVFDGGTADRPYDERFSRELYNTPYPQWSKWTKELVRVCKKGSKIAIMQNYPVPRITKCKWLKLVVIILRIKQFCKIVTIQERVE